jgi:Alpha-L-arabinofuranosidase B (ABFB) domain
MSEDNTDSGLRVGRWIPPYTAERELSNTPANNPRRPVIGRGTGRPLPAAVKSPLRPAFTLAAAAVAAALIALGLVSTGLGKKHADQPAQSILLPPVAPSATIPLWPAPATSATLPVGYWPPSSGSAESGSVDRHGGSRPAASSTSRARPTTDAPRPPSATGNAGQALIVGRTVSLEPYGRSGYRLRHRNFLGRVDPIGPQSSALDRSDSQFVVRAGFVAQGCVAFESVNYPGYFLRHRDFVLHLDRYDGRQLFTMDATFCPVAVHGGAALVLRSTNYPSRYLDVRSDQVFLDELPPDRATAFVVRPPL